MTFPFIETVVQSIGAANNRLVSVVIMQLAVFLSLAPKLLGCRWRTFMDDDHLYQSIRQISVHGQGKKQHHPILGINVRLGGLASVMALFNLTIFEKNKEQVFRLADDLPSSAGVIDRIVEAVEKRTVKSKVGRVFRTWL